MSHDDYNIVKMALEKATKLAGEYKDDSLKGPNPKILVAGKTGIGKSTLLNAVFGKEMADVGVGRPITQDIKEYKSEHVPLTIIDSKGIENKDYETIVGELSSYIQKCANSGDEADAINVAWYCVSAPGARFEPADEAVIKAIGATGIPVIVVLTQGRNFSGEDFKPGSDDAKLRDCIQAAVGSYAHKVILVRAKAVEDEDDDGNAIIKKPRGLNALIEETGKCIPKGRRNAYAQALNVRNTKALEAKVVAATSVVDWATGAAALAAAAPIPGSDFITLAPIQGTMLWKIGNIFGVDSDGTNWTKIITSVAGPLLIGLAARAAVGTLLKLIPGVGSVLGGAISGASAGAVTKIMGELYIEALKTLLHEKQEAGGDMEISSTEAIGALTQAVKNHKS